MIHRDRLVQAFCDLVRIDSPSGEEEAVAQELSRRLSALGFTVQRDAHGNVIASEAGDDPLLLSAHMDTVEPGRGVKPRMEGDRIVTDGATVLGGDCKAGIAAILEALESAREDRARRTPVQVVFTRGEEIGLVGAKNLDMSLIRANRGVVFDGNGPPSKVTIASPSYIGFDVEIKGRAAHAGAEPEKGISAIRIAAEIVAALPQGRLDPETTFNTGLISGGSVRNAVPERAAFSGEFRSRNAATLESLRRQVLDAFQEARRRHPQATVSERLYSDFEGYSLSKDHPMVQGLVKVLATLGMEAELTPSGGGTDGNILNRKGVQCVVVGMSTQEMHTTREFVPIPDLVATARFCQALLVHGL
ncbi:MAG: M20/M25/M40 family metallo-hydrolase [Chloroflexi bacterium]|nr:M20/M25/M40 family metallo-hydrolase [Chloroflexota bacterium]